MQSKLWIAPVKEQQPLKTSSTTHVELSLNHHFYRNVSIAQQWFSGCPDSRLERQSFNVDIVLLKQTIVKRHFGEDDAERKDMFLTRPHGLEPTNEDVDQALLHVNRANTIWLEIKTRQNIRIETVQSKIPPIPLLREITLSPPDTTITSTVTLALKMKIRHEGEFTYPTVDELLHNLDYALNQQAGSSCLSPESLDAVTNHFTFSVLEVSKDS